MQQRHPFRHWCRFGGVFQHGRIVPLLDTSPDSLVNRARSLQAVVQREGTVFGYKMVAKHLRDGAVRIINDLDRNCVLANMEDDPHVAVVLLRHRRRCLFRARPRAQHGHRVSIRAIATANLRWSVAIELGT